MLIMALLVFDKKKLSIENRNIIYFGLILANQKCDYISFEQKSINKKNFRI